MPWAVSQTVIWTDIWLGWHKKRQNECVSSNGSQYPSVGLFKLSFYAYVILSSNSKALHTLGWGGGPDFDFWELNFLVQRPISTGCGMLRNFQNSFLGFLVDLVAFLSSFKNQCGRAIQFLILIALAQIDTLNIEICWEITEV